MAYEVTCFYPPVEGYGPLATHHAVRVHNYIYEVTGNSGNDSADAVACTPWNGRKEKLNRHTVKFEKLGKTSKNKSECDSFLRSYSRKYFPRGASDYNVIKNNCQGFSYAFAKFLDVSLPSPEFTESPGAAGEIFGQIKGPGCSPQ